VPRRWACTPVRSQARGIAAANASEGEGPGRGVSPRCGAATRRAPNKRRAVRAPGRGARHAVDRVVVAHPRCTRSSSHTRGGPGRLARDRGRRRPRVEVGRHP